MTSAKLFALDASLGKSLGTSVILKGKDIITNCYYFLFVQILLYQHYMIFEPQKSFPTKFST